MARDSGAKKVYFASASPPIRFPNIYGIDMPSRKDLIANEKSTTEVCEAIGADKLIYQDLEDLVYAVQAGNEEIKKFETSVFTGEYLTDVGDKYFQDLEKKRHST